MHECVSEGLAWVAKIVGQEYDQSPDKSRGGPSCESMDHLERVVFDDAEWWVCEEDDRYQKREDEVCQYHRHDRDLSDENHCK